jgi:hypothetical protein
MTHSYQYDANLPYTRRKLNARFVHNLKKLCGPKHHIHVNEAFGLEERGDIASIFIKNGDNAADIESSVMKLAERYGIGSDYILTYDDIFDGDGKYIDFHLSKKVP